MQKQGYSCLASQNAGSLYNHPFPTGQNKATSFIQVLFLKSLNERTQSTDWKNKGNSMKIS